MLRLYRRTRGPDPAPPAGVPAVPPRVVVQLPLYNEPFVVERLVAAVGELVYPPARLEVQVLDDSDDETVALAAAAVARLCARGLDAHHLRRGARDGYKAGALAFGLARSTAELVAIFDADALPQPDFLARILPYFTDPGVGMVQARWTHLNRRASWLTRAQATLLDGHFLLESAVRSRSGLFFNFNGTAGVWRRTAIESAGGWQADTLTEDLDLSYRAQLAGWRFVFLADETVPAELPNDIPALKCQQRRWARGSAQTAVKLLPRLLSARLALPVRLEAAAHLLANAAGTLLVALVALHLALAMEGRPPAGIQAIGAAAFALACGSMLAFYGVALSAAGLRRWEIAGTLPLALALGAGLAVNNGIAFLAGLLRRGGVFERTPKHGSAAEGPQRRSLGAKSRVSRLVTWCEIGLAVALGRELLESVATGAWSALPFLGLAAGGLAWVGASSLTRPPPERPDSRLHGNRSVRRA